MRSSCHHPLSDSDASDELERDTGSEELNMWLGTGRLKLCMGMGGGRCWMAAAVAVDVADTTGAAGLVHIYTQQWAA